MILTIEIEDAKYDELNADFANHYHPFGGPRTVDDMVAAYIDDMYSAYQRRMIEKAIVTAQPIALRATVDIGTERKAKIDAAIAAAEVKEIAPK